MSSNPPLFLMRGWLEYSSNELLSSGRLSSQSVDLFVRSEVLSKSERFRVSVRFKKKKIGQGEYCRTHSPRKSDKKQKSDRMSFSMTRNHGNRTGKHPRSIEYILPRRFHCSTVIYWFSLRLLAYKGSQPKHIWLHSHIDKITKKSQYVRRFSRKSAI